MLRRLQRLFCCTASEEDDDPAENRWKEEEEEEEEEERRPHRARKRTEEEEEERRKYRAGEVEKEEEEEEEERGKYRAGKRKEEEEPFFSLFGSDSDLGGFSQRKERNTSCAPHEFIGGSAFMRSPRVANIPPCLREMVVGDVGWSQEADTHDDLRMTHDDDFGMSEFDFPKFKLGSVMKKRKSSSFSRAASSSRTALTSVLRHLPAPPPAEVTVSEDIYEASSSSYFFCPPPVHPGSVPDLQSPSAQVDVLNPVPAAAAGAEHAAESPNLMEVELSAVDAVSCTVINATLSRTPTLIAAPSSPEEFKPELLSAGSHEEEEEEEEEEGSFRFQCSRPGLYQCSVTGLLFHMDGEGDVLYRTVPWNRRLLAQRHKQPAGPLFDIQCVQQCVRQLHLPHCEIHSTAAAPFLSVAHVTDEGVDFLRPQQVTETHLVLNISGFSGYGNVKEADSPPGPVRALVLLFYTPPAQEEPESVLKVLLLPGNVVVFDVVRQRKKLCPDERYLETPSRCRLQPQQEYTLSTHPEEEWILVQPKEAEFDSEGYDNYIPSFEVVLERILKHLKLIVRDVDSSNSLWERRVNLRLGSTVVPKTCDQGPSGQRLLDVRSSFIDGVSAPVLQSLLDKLLEKQVLSDSEKDEVSKPQSDRDRARYVIDVVRKKGDTASSEMIDFLCELDPCLCQHLGLS